jgi:guanylate kinase
MNGSLFIVSAPSGAGKTTLVNALVKLLPNLCISVSYTTRQMRSGEQEGVDYHFVSHDEFKSLLKQGVFLEHAEVFGHFYGTSRIWVEEARQKGFDVILEIDWQGAKQVRMQLVETQSIFVLPLSLNILENRLQKRHTDNPMIIQERMQEAKEQMSHYAEFDYLIFNDNFEAALAELKSVVRCQRLRWRGSCDERMATIEKLIS